MTVRSTDGTLVSANGSGLSTDDCGLTTIVGISTGARETAVAAGSAVGNGVAT